MNIQRPSMRTRGFTLIEVLIAVLIFSVGLLGMAGIMILSVQSNHAGFQRTQVSVLAQNMADRMRANPIGIWDGGYNNAFYPVATAEPACYPAGPCSPDNVATHDQVQWSQLLTTFLPSDGLLDANILCTPAAGSPVTPAQYPLRPPYDGTCAMTITWTEQSVAIKGVASAQTFAWVFQP
ncbi:MAG: type IV pilus modification protein PilV [Rhodanobacteraceae bacterium]